METVEQAFQRISRGRFFEGSKKYKRAMAEAERQVAEQQAAPVPVTEEEVAEAMEELELADAFEDDEPAPSLQSTGHLSDLVAKFHKALQAAKKKGELPHYTADMQDFIFTYVHDEHGTEENAWDAFVKMAKQWTREGYKHEKVTPNMRETLLRVYRIGKRVLG